jgi:hypothetical protein
MSTLQLPAGLAPWSEALSVLEPRLAVALGPLVRQLDQLVTRHDSGSGLRGELDGYGGLTRRGAPARLLVSELALAQELPLEFLRRAATSELLYLAPSYLDDVGRGRVCVLVDTGPDQIGAGRLVQLAGLVVMYRRAARRRAELMLGVLGDEPGAWRAGDIKRVLRGWLAARRADRPVDSDIVDWTSDVDSEDEVWLFAGQWLGASVAGRRRVVVSRECAWGLAGASAVEVMLEGDRIELALPHGDVAVRALRGAAFREAAPALVTSGIRYPTFPSAGAWLLGRGSDPAEVVAIPVPHGGGEGGRPRRHRFSGPVITASVIGRRVVALVLVGSTLRAEFHGKRPGHVDQIAVAPGAIGLDGPAAAVISERPMPPLLYDRGSLLTYLAEAWWRLVPDEEPQQDNDILAVLPDVRYDVPRIACAGFQHKPEPGLGPLPERAEVVLGPDRLVAWREDAIRWHIAPGGMSVTVDPDDSVLGLMRVDDAPAVVTVSTGGLIVRLNRPGGRRTLTRWSGGIAAPALHPVRPWLAVQRDDQRVEVADVETDTLLLTVPGVP